MLAFHQLSSVIWDGFGLSSRFSGVGRHAYCLSQALKELDISPLVFYADKCAISGLSHIFPMLPLVNFASRSKLGWSRLISSKSTLAQLPRSSVFHGLCNFNIPLSRSCRLKRVVTIHDIIPIIAKGQVSRASTLQLAFLLPKVLEAADRIICVSEWTKDTIIGNFPSVTGKLKVIPNGFYAPAHVEAKKMVPVYSSEVVQGLSVMRFEPYKRFDRLVNILDRMSTSVSIKLVTDDCGERWLLENAKQHLTSGSLSIHKGVSDSALECLFNASDFLLHTSDYEGFCLPAAQAIAHAKPVIFKSGSGIDEVVGPAGLGVGDHLEDWCDAIANVLNQIDGSAIKTHFSSQKPWAHVARELNQLYNEVSTE